MPDFHNPRFVHVDPGGGGAVIAAVVVVAGVSGLLWLARELLHIWIELVVIVGGTLAFVVVAGIACAVQSRRGHLRVNQAAKAEAIANARARVALPAGDVHHHVHYEEHTHHHYDERQLHLHQAPAAETPPAIAARKVVPGVVVGATREAIDARKAPLHQLDATECAAVEEKP
jgi:hypothetical protein